MPSRGRWLHLARPLGACLLLTSAHCRGSEAQAPVAGERPASREPGSSSARPTRTGEGVDTCQAEGSTVQPVARERYVTTSDAAGSFPLLAAGNVAPLVVSSTDFAGVLSVARQLRADLENVGGVSPQLVIDTLPTDSRRAVIIGTLGKSPLIDRLVQAGKLDVSSVQGRWETFVTQIVNAPAAGVDQALVIAGSDKRGTMYGMYDLSTQAGVSPWYWWADVPIPRQTALYVTAGRHSLGTPVVKYRGFFINDENPALFGMVHEKFGGFNQSFYAKVFELLLRLKANTLWPAMWGKAFNADDPGNEALADRYGIVMGTSHQEPMMRAQQEWDSLDAGLWDYATHGEELRRFWTGGIERMGSFESLVTIGMRGENDTSLSASTNMALLRQIMSDQRGIIRSVTGKDPSTVPQVWTVYKDMLAYYDLGVRAPDDVLTVFTDDNWGNITRLPSSGAPTPAGGWGLYYHYDYVGSPRDYKWLNTNSISRVWEQLHLALAYGVRGMWLVNVGDIKPMEFPTQFFFDYAYDPDLWPAASLPDYTRQWAQQQFGADRAAAIADILTKYTKYNARRKPELVDPTTYSLTDYREAETVVSEYDDLAAAAQAISDALPPGTRDAFYELVLWPVQACANLNDLYLAVAKNALYAAQGRAATNEMATQARSLFANDAKITSWYNKTLAAGKWDHMADQTHIGYTSWRDPPANVMPAVTTIPVPPEASMGVAIEGSPKSWTTGTADATLPELSPYQSLESRYIEVFDRGQRSLSFTAAATVPWITITPSSGTVTSMQRLWVTVDWKRAPNGAAIVPITITGPAGSKVVVNATVDNPPAPAGGIHGFVESAGYVSIESEHYSCAVAAGPIAWQRVPDLGRTSSGLMASPVTAARQTPGGASAHLEYPVTLFTAGRVQVDAYLSPTADMWKTGLRYAVSFDDGPLETVDMVADSSAAAWRARVAANINVQTTTHTIETPGAHVLKFWMVDPGVVLQKIVIETTGARSSYLGPPESVRVP